MVHSAVLVVYFSGVVNIIRVGDVIVGNIGVNEFKECILLRGDYMILIECPAIGYAHARNYCGEQTKALSY